MEERGIICFETGEFAKTIPQINLKLNRFLNL